MSLTRKRDEFHALLQAGETILDDEQIQRMVDGLVPIIACIAELAEDDVHLLGTTWLGGYPDLADDGWPRRFGQALIFLGQFRLDELTSLQPDLELPAHGLLRFFFQEHGQGHGTSYVVIYSDKPNVRRILPPDHLSGLLPCQTVKLSARYHVASGVIPWEAYVEAGDLANAAIDYATGGYSQLLGFEGPYEAEAHCAAQALEVQTG